MFGFVCLLFVLETYSLTRSVFEKTPPNKGARRHERRGSFLFLGLRRSLVLGLRRSWESNQEHFEKNQFFLTPPASGIEPGTFSNVQ